MLLLGTEFEKSFPEDGKTTLVHLLHGQKQYAITLLTGGELMVAALSGLEGVYNVPEDNDAYMDNAIFIVAKDDKDLVIEDFIKEAKGEQGLREQVPDEVAGGGQVEEPNDVSPDE